MLSNFLSRNIHLAFCFLILFFWWFSQLGIGFFVLVIYSSLWWLFRRNHREEDFPQETLQEAVFSPANGKVLEVSDKIENSFFGKDLHLIRIRINPFCEYSVLLPVQSEVQDFHFYPVWGPLRWLTVPKDFIERALGVCVTLRTRSGHLVGMQFLRCFLGFWPRLVVVPGDRGRALSRMGFFPFGGNLILYLPGHYEIVAKKGDDVIAGLTILATTDKMVNQDEDEES